MDNVHIVTLGCHHCHGEHLHEVTYADDLFTAELILTTSGYQL